MKFLKTLSSRRADKKPAPLPEPEEIVEAQEPAQETPELENEIAKAAFEAAVQFAREGKLVSARDHLNLAEKHEGAGKPATEAAILEVRNAALEAAEGFAARNYAGLAKESLTLAEQVTRRLPEDKRDMEEGIARIRDAALSSAVNFTARYPNAARKSLRFAEDVAKRLPAEKSAEALREGLTGVYNAATFAAQEFEKNERMDYAVTQQRLAREIARKLDL
jgi:hypothetical protein